MMHLRRLWMLVLVGVLCGVGALTSTAWAFERTQTCYPKSDGRTPTCSKKQKPIPIQWKDGCTTWRTHNEFPDEYLEAVQKSFETWNEVSGSYFQTFYAGSSDQFGAAYDCKGGDENQNVVSYLEDWPSSVAGQDVVALTSVVYTTDKGEILDADIRMNGEHFIWKEITSVSHDSRIVDVQNILTHEVGHFLGLEHASAENHVGHDLPEDATMWSHTNMNEIKRRVLTEDDKAGVRAIYPAEDGPEEACTPPPGPNDHVSADSFDPTRMRCTQKKRGCAAHDPAAPWTWLGAICILASLLVMRRRARPQ